MNPLDTARQWLGPILLISASFFAADFTAAVFDKNLGAGAPVVAPTSRIVAVNANATMGLTNPAELQNFLENTARHAPVATANATTTGVNGSVVAVNGTVAPGVATVTMGALPKLTGTLSGAGHSLAVLQSGDETRVCGINETMNGYTVKEVTQFGAVLRDIQGVDHRLSLDLGQGQTAPTQPVVTPAPGPTSTPHAPVGTATPPADGALSHTQMVDFIDHYNQWIGKMNIHPLKKGDEVVGVQVMYSQGDNPLAKLGVSSGDVLTSLNGHPLRGPEDLQWAYGELRNNTTFAFEIERGGKPQNFEVHLSDN